ncbi:MAG: acylneuraminate cytidylyltransferase [Anaerolineaceae bacterium]|nr:acylneuraminate cytidylyltransferase [Anaerolineaceae bacterium]
MVKAPEVLAIIPARGGSKGVPRKNLREFAGAPLIAYSIVAALQAEMVSRVIVSTDDEEIAAIAREWGAETPFMRPAALAQDDTTDFPVFEHALTWLKENEGYQADIIIQLRPTSPVRPVGLLDEAIRKLIAHPEADCVRGVVPAGQNPYKMWQLRADGSLKPILGVEGIKEAYNTPRQALPETFWQTGHIDAIRSSTILEKHSLTGEIILPIHIDPLYTVDIDTLEDFKNSARLMSDPRLKAVDPLKRRRAFPDKVSLLVMDFDGIMTDDKVYTDMNGVESVRSSRSDGYGLDMLRRHSETQALIMSREVSSVVAARAKKLGLEVFQAVMDKEQAIQSLIQERKLKADEVVYIGNDLNDLVVIPHVGYFCCPSDAHPMVRRQADLVLDHPGGDGAIREICEKILAQTRSL